MNISTKNIQICLYLLWIENHVQHGDFYDELKLRQDSQVSGKNGFTNIYDLVFEIMI